jgi:3-oxoadipate enol-lactonase
MPKVEVNGTRLFYTLSGAVPNPVLMFSNSLGTTVDMWEPQLAAFESRFRILRYDMRGHGQSDVTDAPCSIGTLGQDVVSLLDHLRIPKVHFCGLSVGGVIGQWLGANASQRLNSLLLCNTAAKIGIPEMWNQRIDEVERNGMAPIVDATLERWFTPAFRNRSPAIVAAWRAMLLANSPRGYTLLCAAIRDMDQRELVRSIRLPTRIVAGNQDPTTTVEDAEFLQARIAGATLVRLPAAHISNVEAASLFNAAVTEFLAGPADPRNG